MISLTCAQCKNTLEVDDAFAGGVCRCQFCGTIQTVPRPGNRPSAPGGRAAASGDAGESPRALYQVKSRRGESSAPSGLEELAEVVHSSGLSGSGLANRSSRPTQQYATPQTASKKSNVPILVAGAVALALILTIAAIFLLRSSASTTTGPAVAGGGGAAMEVPAEPSFEKIKLPGEKTVFLIDRGDATAGYFPALKTLVTRSVASLGPDRRFQVIAWENATRDAHPRDGMAYASKDEVARLQKWFDNVATGQATSVTSALTTALNNTPDAIVLITAKSDQLDATFAGEVLDKARGKTVKLHTVTLGESPSDDPLKKIALDTGGTFLHLTRADLAAHE
ncbi:MAG TPA: vWA domain-containing protein [Tepidisphaeraceae bacterium]